MPMAQRVSWALDSSLHVLVTALVGVLPALLVHGVSATVVLRMTRSMLAAAECLLFLIKMALVQIIRLLFAI